MSIITKLVGRLAVCAIAGSSLSAGAEELKLLSAGAARPLLQHLIPAFEKETGNKFSSAWFGPPHIIKNRIMGGEAVDIVFSFDPTLGELVAARKVTAPIDIARAGIGVGVQKGAVKPDLRDREATKRFLLDVPRISGAGFNTGSVGSWVKRAFETMGIEREVLPKYKIYETGVAIIEAVAKGEVDAVLSVMPDLADSAIIDYVGPFPPDIQQYDIVKATIATGSANAKQARAFIDFVSRPEHAELLRQKWLYPPR